MGYRIEGIPELRRRLEHVSDPRLILRALQTETVLQAKHLVPRRTGNLGRSIRAGYISGNDAFVKAEAAYAAPVEFGSREHDIVPRKGKALRFPAKGVPVTLSGRVRSGAARSLGKNAYVFRTKVHIPRQRPRPYLVPGAKAAVADSGRDIVVNLWNKGG